MKSKARSNTKWTHFLFKTHTHLSSNPQSQISRVTDVLLSWIFIFFKFRTEMQGLLVQIQLQTASEIRPKWDNAEGYKHPSEVFNKTLLHFSIQTFTADCQIVYLSTYHTLEFTSCITVSKQFNL